MFGLLDKDLHYITKAIKKYAEIERVKVFGSRALGNYKKGSDVDMAIFGESINGKIVAGLSDILNEEYPLPYFFDVIHYESISNQKLAEHIDNSGIEIFPTLKGR
ncbi:DNA polymerase III subunit beta [Anaerobacillus alkalidiazotrophicus]|uniref:DNA polymerase III subunit beta n=1 Tax=Anaerobacillus alkalidiazotrophicus TaxID=472963 RepID=A0A1S2M507_9BACI|nr:nucleotidyltransferase domain-containing protein [Anaerobacillus alkalidiazotrophicus]OIJ18064.1 DNA polymerase III subunit beta [Anaerobacillus alkalidiazotrophicus]OIJ19543.1 DNA polymerase III subunit beta [Anaerobacillus alkalidiazotrophicus]